MANFLDVVALGTVADVVPLYYNNRILVAQGLKRIRAGMARPGILAMLEVAGRKPDRVVASDLGFALGPRLNARSEEHTSELQSRGHLVCRLLLVKKKNINECYIRITTVTT